ATVVLTVWYATKKPFGGYESSKWVGMAAFAVLVGVALNFGRSIYYKLTADPNMALIIGNMHKNRYLRSLLSSNDWYKFVTLHPKVLFSNPFVNYNNDATGRHYFWHTYLKSILFGFDRWPYGKLAV